MEYVQTYLDDLLIIINDDFKDQIAKLNIVLARISATDMRVNDAKSNSFQNRLNILVTGSPEKVSSQYTIRWNPSLRVRLQQPERNYANLLV